MVCEWFALCENEATILVPHPVLDTVPCCDRCASKLDLKGTPIFIPGESLGERKVRLGAQPAIPGGKWIQQ